VGEWGNIYRRIADNGKVKAMRSLKRDYAKVMAAAQALHEIRSTLTDEQAAIVAKTLSAELVKQGY
jgi:hypothetical protein